jgi:hypothetical protein
MTSTQTIAHLVFTYAERLDAGDLPGVAASFAHATYGQAGGPSRRGDAEVLGALRARRVLHDGSPRTRHVITNLIIDVDESGDAARARSYFTVLQATTTLSPRPILAGRYQDRFARVDGTWRFAERLIHVDLVGELGQHLREPPAGRSVRQVGSIPREIGPSEGRFALRPYQALSPAGLPPRRPSRPSVTSDRARARCEDASRNQSAVSASVESAC